MENPKQLLLVILWEVFQKQAILFGFNISKEL